VLVEELLRIVVTCLRDPISDTVGWSEDFRSAVAVCPAEASRRDRLANGEVVDP